MVGVGVGGGDGLYCCLPNHNQNMTTITGITVISTDYRCLSPWLSLSTTGEVLLLSRPHYRGRGCCRTTPRSADPGYTEQRSSDDCVFFFGVVVS